MRRAFRGMVILIILSSVLLLSGCRQPADVLSVETMRGCEADADCIIVNSLSCDCNCKEAIAKKDLESWNVQIALHADDACEFECGACDDAEVTEARCVENICEKAYPDYIPDERVFGMPIKERDGRPIPPPIGNTDMPEGTAPPETASIPALPPVPMRGG